MRCSAPDYWRVRIGVGHPGVKELVQPYVLQNFAGEELTGWVEPLLDAVAETIPLLVAGAPDAFMSEVARRFAPPDDGADAEASRSLKRKSSNIWVSIAALSDCRMSANRRSSTR